MVHYDVSYADLEFFLLIFVRITAMVYIVPFFSMNAVPRRFRAGLSFFMAVLVYGTMSTHEPIFYDTVFQYAIIVLKEMVTGLLLGMGVNMCTTILNLTGAVADMEIGLSMMTSLDPATRTQTTITATLYQYMVTLILLISGLYEYVIGALGESYQLIPVNGAVLSGERLLRAVSSFMAEYVSVSFRICLPIFLGILLLDVILGIMAKVAPQMNMFAVGIQLKMLTGLVVIFFTLGLLPTFADLIFTEAKKITVLFVEAMI